MWQGERCSAPLSAPALWVLCALSLAWCFFPFPLRARYWGGRIFAASAPPPPPPACPPGATRNQLDAAALQARGVRLVVGESGELRFPHSLVDAECPRYITSLQDMSAGIGHRTREWATSLWLALTFNLTLVHRPVDFALERARREHGGYEGWDAFLGLAIGELEGEPSVGEDVSAKLLPSIGKWGAPTERVLALWAPLLTAPNLCNVMFVAPGDQAPRDISAAVRPYMTWKFAAAAAARARSGDETPALRYDPAAVTIAVHYRVGDIVPTPEAALWANTRLALSSLRAEGVIGALHVHVHTDGPVALAHFGVIALLEDEVEGGAGEGSSSGVEVWHHFNMSATETMWHLVNADVLVGSRSGFSWLAGLLSPRSLALLQRGSQWHETCADEGTAVCCTGGVCEEAGTVLLELASQRIAAALACGDFGPHTSAFLN